MERTMTAAACAAASRNAASSGWVQFAVVRRPPSARQVSGSVRLTDVLHGRGCVQQ